MERRTPSLGLAILVVLIASVLISLTVLVWGQDLHITLIISAIIAGIIGVVYLKYDYRTIEKGIIDGIMTGMQACLILFTVGPLVGTWIVSGVVPSMIYYGLSVLSPSIFLFATLFICSVVSLATGTSWGTAGTVGIALMGIGVGLGVPPALTAGVIISGGYFGDKMSPLSDTTNLAPAVAGTDLFQHIRAMMWTSGPTYIIVTAITLVIGFKYAGGSLDAAKIQAIQALMKAEFWVSPISLIAPIVVIALSAMGKPALPSLWCGILIAIIFALVQGVPVADVLDIMQNGYVPTVTAEIADAADGAAVAALLAQRGIELVPEIGQRAAKDLVELMARGGLQSMNWTVSLIICAFTFGSTLEVCGFLKVFLEAIMKPIKSAGGMVMAVIASCAFCDIFLGDQYLAIAMPGRMFKPAFDKAGLHPRMLSRSLEDSGTLISVLVPWNTCGAYHAGVLGIPTISYLPYAFFNYLNPLIAIIITYMGIGISWRGKDGELVVGGKKRPQELA
jgi:NhaC family Na+:H+ antiporter